MNAGRPDSGLLSCLRTPIPEIAATANVLSEAVRQYLGGHVEAAAALIASTNTPILREWERVTLGKRSPYVVVRNILGAPSTLERSSREPVRMPNAAQRAQLIRDQAGTAGSVRPVIRVEVRRKLHKLFPEALPWGRTNLEQHAAFQALWMQFDHVIPHARGGRNDLGNVIITCAPCNFARMNSHPRGSRARGSAVSAASGVGVGRPGILIPKQSLSMNSVSANVRGNLKWLRGRRVRFQCSRAVSDWKRRRERLGRVEV